MDSETHFSIVFNIYGGSNQILPNATSATQNYYGDEAELEKDDVRPVQRDTFLQLLLNKSCEISFQYVLIILLIK